MATLADVMQKGEVTEFPACNECKRTKGELMLSQGSRVFLVSFHGSLVCGECAYKLSIPKRCEIGHLNPGNSKFCSQCGEKFG